MDISLEFALKIGGKARTLKFSVATKSFDTSNWKLSSGSDVGKMMMKGMDEALKRTSREGRL